MQFDYNCLCQGLGHLSGLEVRIYKAGKLAEHYSHTDIDFDFTAMIESGIERENESAYYIETSELLLFGVIKVKNDGATLVIGPTFQIRPGENETVEILRDLGESHGRLSELQTYLSNIVPYPFENFLEIICFVNYALNEEKLTVSHLVQHSWHKHLPIKGVEKHSGDLSEDIIHNTFQMEKTALSYISSGNVAAVQSFFQKPPTGRIGAIATDELRQRKNAFICAATLFSRAAISGGLPSRTAFALSDMYIQKAESMKSASDIAMLNMQMMLDYTKRVEAIKCGSDQSPLAKEIMRFVLKNIGGKILIDDVADALNMNRSYLCERFKNDTGVTIGDFITTVKIDEAKRLLLTSDMKISQISDFLAFSSQSYFQNVFKKHVGQTPKEFQNQFRTE